MSSQRKGVYIYNVCIYNVYIYVYIDVNSIYLYTVYAAVVDPCAHDFLHS